MIAKGIKPEQFASLLAVADGDEAWRSVPSDKIFMGREEHLRAKAALLRRHAEPLPPLICSSMVY
jgi:hypothetical protein